MSSFEQEYYESDRFWEGEAIQDENNNIRIRETAALIPSDAVSLVDIGCGNGVFVNYLQKEFPKLSILAIDRSKTALKFVRTEKKEGDIADIPLADRSVDCATCLEVVEHLPVDVYEKALSELTRIASRYVIISVPYAENLEKNHTQCPQCKTLFNADLHLRNFSEEKIQQLLDKFGFECISKNKTGVQYFYKGHYTFTRFFYPEHFREWRSPICPVCGYKSPEKPAELNHQVPVSGQNSKPRRSLLSYFTVIPKMFWPKEKKYYWIMGLYKRK